MHHNSIALFLCPLSSDSTIISLSSSTYQLSLNLKEIVKITTGIFWKCGTNHLGKVCFISWKKTKWRGLLLTSKRYKRKKIHTFNSNLNSMHWLWPGKQSIISTKRNWWLSWNCSNVLVINDSPQKRITSSNYTTTGRIAIYSCCATQLLVLSFHHWIMTM